MNRLTSFSSIDSSSIAAAGDRYGTPLYLYDEQVILDKCRSAVSMPNAFGLTVRYAMKANSNKSILNIVHANGLKIDASSMNEVRRASNAGIPYRDIMLTTQEVPLKQELQALKEMMHAGLTYNVCSLQQLQNIGDFAAENSIKLAIRCHPGIGAGESATRNTGDNYSCFGIHLSDIPAALDYAKGKGVVFNLVHTHIGSGGDPATWRNNIDLELSIIEQYFPFAEAVSFGGGLKEARMPDEIAANIEDLGTYAKQRITAFYQKTNRKLKMEIEPGTYIMALSGFIVTTVIDKKKTGPDGFNFIVLDGGMEVNTRPLLYASRHPFYVVSQTGDLLSSEFDEGSQGGYRAVLVGRCCESGDSQTLDASGLTVPRGMAEPQVGDYIAIGGAGAYCSSMSPMNYNSQVQSREVLYTREGDFRVIREKQTLEQILANER